MQFLANVLIVVLALAAQIVYFSWRTSRRDLPLCISAVILELWLAHADDQRDVFALGTVNATMALHGGQCQVLSVALTTGR